MSQKGLATATNTWPVKLAFLAEGSSVSVVLGHPE